MNKAAEPFDVKANVSAEEWQARVDLAAAYRLVDHHRWTDRPLRPPPRRAGRPARARR